MQHSRRAADIPRSHSSYAVSVLAGRTTAAALSTLAAILLLYAMISLELFSSPSPRALFASEGGTLASGVRYTRHRSSPDFTVQDLLAALESGGSARDEMSALLRGSRFAAYFFECRPFTSGSYSTQPFEFVLVETSFGGGDDVDLEAFKDHFAGCEEGSGAVDFASLGGDAQLISPCPSHADKGAYAHLAAFVRRAPALQVDALWRRGALAIRAALGSSRGKPLWLSTSGKGVSYLHLRVDSRPKYYAFPEYKVFV